MRPQKGARTASPRAKRGRRALRAHGSRYATTTKRALRVRCGGAFRWGRRVPSSWGRPPRGACTGVKRPNAPTLRPPPPPPSRVAPTGVLCNSAAEWPPLSSKSKKPAVLTDSGKLNKTVYYFV